MRKVILVNSKRPKGVVMAVFGMSSLFCWDLQVHLGEHPAAHYP
jgi:hypothetical protein